jgi:hypothetical protein
MIKGGKFIILVLYVDDFLLASSDKRMLHETMGFLSSNFVMKDDIITCFFCIMLLSADLLTSLLE